MSNPLSIVGEGAAVVAAGGVLTGVVCSPLEDGTLPAARCILGLPRAPGRADHVMLIQCPLIPMSAKRIPGQGRPQPQISPWKTLETFLFWVRFLARRLERAL